MNEKVEVDCKHCEGTGKCGCLTCNYEYLEELYPNENVNELRKQAQIWNDDKRTVVCSICKGTGSRSVIPSKESSEEGGFRDV